MVAKGGNVVARTDLANNKYTLGRSAPRDVQRDRRQGEDAVRPEVRPDVQRPAGPVAGAAARRRVRRREQDRRGQRRDQRVPQRRLSHARRCGPVDGPHPATTRVRGGVRCHDDCSAHEPMSRRRASADRLVAQRDSSSGSPTRRRPLLFVAVFFVVPLLLVAWMSGEPLGAADRRAGPQRPGQLHGASETNTLFWPAVHLHDRVHGDRHRPAGGRGAGSGAAGPDERAAGSPSCAPSFLLPGRGRASRRRRCCSTASTHLRSARSARSLEAARPARTTRSRSWAARYRRCCRRHS